MKSLLTALSVLTIGTTTGNLLISSGKNALETNIIYQNNKEIPDPSGVNYADDSVVKVNNSIFKKWLSEDDPTMREEIIRSDLLNSKIFNNKFLHIDESLYIADSISYNIYKISTTPHTSIYGFILVFNATDYHLVSINGQFSPISKNSSYTQENYCFLCHNQLNTFISRQQGENIYLAGKKVENIFNIINNFPQDPAGQKSEISKEYLEIMAQIIINHFDEINNHFKSSEIRGTGGIVYGNTLCECKGIYEEK